MRSLEVVGPAVGPSRASFPDCRSLGGAGIEASAVGVVTLSAGRGRFLSVMVTYTYYLPLPHLDELPLVDAVLEPGVEGQTCDPIHAGDVLPDLEGIRG